MRSLRKAACVILLALTSLLHGCGTAEQSFSGSGHPPAPSEPVIIHITRTGTKYHSAGCSHLSQSDISVTLQEAKPGALLLAQSAIRLNSSISHPAEPIPAMARPDSGYASHQACEAVPPSSRDSALPAKTRPPENHPKILRA